MELARLVLAQNKKQLLDTWMAEDKIACSEELGDLLQSVDAEMALRVYIKAKANTKVVAALAAREFERWASTARWPGLQSPTTPTCCSRRSCQTPRVR